jgi:hypothetical protein
MSERPHDTHDLYLAPVALELDRRLEEFEGLNGEDVVLRIALTTNRQGRDAEHRAQLTLEAVTHSVDLHGWDVNLTPRGLRLAHGDHQLVLGLPASLRNYLQDG